MKELKSIKEIELEISQKEFPTNNGENIKLIGRILLLTEEEKKTYDLENLKYKIDIYFSIENSQYSSFVYSFADESIKKIKEGFLELVEENYFDFSSLYQDLIFIERIREKIYSIREKEKINFKPIMIMTKNGEAELFPLSLEEEEKILDVIKESKNNYK